MPTTTRKQLDKNWHENKESQINRKRNGVCAVVIGRLQKRSRHSAKVRLFAGTIKQIPEAEMDEQLGYEKNPIAGNNSENSWNGYGKKTISSEYGDCEISVPYDRN